MCTLAAWSACCRRKPGLALPRELSGGHAQPVALARALLADPALPVVDEPTRSLDAATPASVLEVLLERRGHAGAVTIVVTHDVSFVEHADIVVELEPPENAWALLARPTRARSNVGRVVLELLWPSLTPHSGREQLSSSIIGRLCRLDPRRSACGTRPPTTENGRRRSRGRGQRPRVRTRERRTPGSVLQQPGRAQRALLP